MKDDQGTGNTLMTKIIEISQERKMREKDY